MVSTSAPIRTSELTAGGRRYRYVPLSEVASANRLAGLPYVTRLLLENVARRAPEALPDALRRALDGGPDCEMPIHPNRLMLHDTTCLPALADIAGMRDAVSELGGDAADVAPAIPVDLTVDHSVTVEQTRTPDALEGNLLVDFRRNRQRYEFIRWAEKSLANFRVVPPATGIIHQVNMESLARVVWEDGTAGDDRVPVMVHPDLLVATDSHTPMVNAIGVLAWGVGGLQGQAAMLGEPVTIRFPTVVGVYLTGSLRPGVTATDLALTVTELLRAHGVVDKFVEFVGPGATALGWAARAAVANMAPEYGATCAFFPFDDETAEYLELTARSAQHRELVDAYLHAQGLYRSAGDPLPRYDDDVTLDLSTVEPSLAGPRLPHERLPLSRVPTSFRAAAERSTSDYVGSLPEGAIAIASITSCTNTANPALMVQAGLLAHRAAERGLTARPWVKTSLSPGSRVVTDYLDRASLLEPLAQTGFALAGYGCMTCIGNSGPLHTDVAAAVEQGFLPAAVVSGNRNFGGRINPQISLAYLASPPLVVAYALAGSVAVDLTEEPLGHDPGGTAVYLRDLWPGDSEVQEIVDDAVRKDMFARNTETLRAGTSHWHAVTGPDGTRFPWDEDSTYIRRPPYLTGVKRKPETRLSFTRGRVLLWLGDDITTDHISPAGAIPTDSAAGHHLHEQGVPPEELNQYSTRRSNHQVMLRGAFTNPTVSNLLLPADDHGRGAYAISADGDRVLPVFDAARSHAKSGTPLVILAGRNYGAGSSRDWAAKAQALLGVRAVIAESFERIHRANLVGMGVLPLRLPDGITAADCRLTAEDDLELTGLDTLAVGDNPATLRIHRTDGTTDTVPLSLRVDTRNEIEYLRHGGTLPYVVRRLAATDHHHEGT